MQAAISDNNSKYVVDDSPSSESHYRARFYFNPNNVTMGNGNSHYILRGRWARGGADELEPGAAAAGDQPGSAGGMGAAG